jgi:hemerythrin
MNTEEKKIMWKDDLVTGIKLIDRQHREFIGLVNKLFDLSMEPDDHKLMSSSFAFLRYYINEHFSVEEAAMKEYKYPHYPMHRNIHLCFREEFDRLESFLKGKVHPHDVLVKLNYLTVNWFLSHIKIDDKKLCRYLVAHEGENREPLVSKLDQIVALFFKKDEVE